MTTANELPEGSIVAEGPWVVQANESSGYWRWSATNGHTYSDGQVAESIERHGATVLRHGYGDQP